ncbi:hypothetical protein [Nocardiopsis ansamitocini]|uniref:Uncharacterized protein n=1 Tax=Nocardiopsis ansamitocini TaxID=1670832 RepID=A0A9W6PAZ4_9ACTN|nr:hypothetical protein [Nocardiopsis ansamitocini]GLU50233.1 hypothetical protein Nans01_45840 [Nocardiopsis ansamitocini]
MAKTASVHNGAALATSPAGQVSGLARKHDLAEGAHPTEQWIAVKHVRDARARRASREDARNRA